MIKTNLLQYTRLYIEIVKLSTLYHHHLDGLIALLHLASPSLFLPSSFFLPSFLVTASLRTLLLMRASSPSAFAHIALIAPCLRRSVSSVVASLVHKDSIFELAWVSRE